MTEELLKALPVFLMSMLELWAAVPLGFALKLHPFVNFTASVLGAASGSALVIFGSEGIRRIYCRLRPLKKTEYNKDKPPKGRLARIWDRYGIIGLGLAAPWITGAPIGALIGITLKAEPVKLMLWTAAGIVLCAAVFVISGMGLISVMGTKMSFCASYIS